MGYIGPGYTRYAWLGQGVIAIVAVALLLGALPAGLNADDRAAWEALQSGDHFVIMRHAIAPGTGDPANFKIGDCSTQRNLSAAGRRQAALIGKQFRTNGIQTARVRSSQWCRCTETAELLSLGPVEPLPVLNSFFQRFEREARQTKRLKEWLDHQDLTGTLVLVTHQVNITALTNVFPASGEMLIIRRSKRGEYVVVGRIQTDIERQ